MIGGKHSSNAKHSKEKIRAKSKRVENKQERKEKKIKARRDTSYGKANGKKVLKFILFIVIFALIALGIYFAYEHFIKNKDNNTEKNENVNSEVVYENAASYELTEEGDTEEIVKVEGADYLEITQFHVIPDPELSTVSATFKNTSDQVHEDINLLITLYDDNNEEITSLNYNIDKIEANGETLAHAAVKRDLSNCTTCTVALRKNN